jgi:hypothetical protein
MNGKKHISESEGERSIQASYTDFDGDPAFVIADVTTDDAWLSISVGDEAPVGEYR